MNPRPHQRSFAADPTLCDRVFALLDTWLPQLSSMRRQAEALIWRWEETSTPFVHEQDGEVVAHVGVLESRLICRGRERRVGGIHAVCTLERLRRRGLYRTLMDEALAHCDERYDTVKLSTEHPEYYEPFGFRVVPEHRFVAAPPRGGHAAPSHEAFQALDLSRPEDLALLDRLLRERAAPSPTLSALDSDVFKFNAPAFGPRGVHYCAALDLACVMQRDGGTVELYELMAPSYPDFADLVAHVSPRPERVVFYFRPDALGVEAEPEAHRFAGDVLMVRGPLPFADTDGDLPPAMLSPLARH